MRAQRETQVEMPNTPLDKAKTLDWLRGISGDLSTATLKRLDDSLPWYRAMPPARRSAIGLVAQTGITSFINWYDDPTNETWIAKDVFGNAPRELLRSVSLQQTLQMIQCVVYVVEERLIADDSALHEAFLHYSRDVAFAAADVYARAAEARGLWDARLEALVVDSILSGEYDDELPSRVAALGWSGGGEVSVIVGTGGRVIDVDPFRRIARHMGSDLLIGIQGSRIVLVIGRKDWHHDGGQQPEHEYSFLEIAREMSTQFGDGPIVLGPSVPGLIEAQQSAKAALAGYAVVKALRNAPRPCLADDLLPERALAGDAIAKRTLVNNIYLPLKQHSPDLLATLAAYLDTGRSLEATARELYVHPNTVRYRLKRISEVIGWDPTGAREALILQSALILGSIGFAQPRRQ